MSSTPHVAIMSAELVHNTLLPELQIESLDPHNPVVVHYVPSPWQRLGTGNYAAVFIHPDFPKQVVKVYAPGRPGIAEEAEVYRRLGPHPAFSDCLYANDRFLILRRLQGTTLYDCLQQGISIPEQVIKDIDNALDFARQRGLFPHDIHGRNVMMDGQRGVVVDISDFLHQDPCRAWNDVKRAYYWLYRPLLQPLGTRIPYWCLDGVRQVYRWYRRATRQL
ncbi:MAG: serine/threonine protein kinase [Cyanobacteria bacterium P01_A01_bin.135]